jgi:hypothetical protein
MIWQSALQVPDPPDTIIKHDYIVAQRVKEAYQTIIGRAREISKYVSSPNSLEAVFCAIPKIGVARGRIHGNGLDITTPCPVNVKTYK